MNKDLLLDEFSSLPSNINLKTVTKEYVCTRCKKTYKKEVAVINGYEGWKPGGHMCENCKRELIYALGKKQ